MKVRLLIFIVLLSFVFADQDQNELETVDATIGQPQAGKSTSAGQCHTEVNEADQPKLNGVFEEEKENELEKPTIHLESGGFAAIIEDLSAEEQGKLYEKFFQWLDSENVKYPKVSIETKKKVRGLYVKDDLEADASAIELPRHIMISAIAPTADQPKDTPFCDLTRRWNVDLVNKLFDNSTNNYFKSVRASNLLLTLCLIHETKKQGGSFYQSYLDILPKGSPILSSVLDAKKQLESDYYLISDTLFTHPSQGFTFAHYNWATLTVTTRAIEIPLKTRKTPFKALVPLIDLMNSSPSPKFVSKFTPKEQENFIYSFSASRDFDAGEQLFNDAINCHNSLCFLLNHGFIPDVIEHDYIPMNILSSDNRIINHDLLVDFAPSEALQEALLERKIAILLENNLAVIGLFKDRLVELLTIFRILCATEHQLELLPKILQFTAVSESNDICAMNSINTLLSSTLSAYPTTLQYDKMILKHIPEDEIEIRLAIRMRIIEKTIITSLLDELKLLSV